MIKRSYIVYWLLLSATSAFAQQPDLRDIRYGTYDDHTRIVFEFSGKVQPLINDFSSDQKKVELIFSAVNLSASVKNISINDGIVKQVEAVASNDGVIVTIEIAATSSTLRNEYLEGPDRVVIDVYRSDERKLSGAEKLLDEAVNFFERKEYDEAVAKIRLSLRLRPGYTDAYYYAGIIRKERKQFDMAKFNFSKALADEEKWGESHLHLAEILLMEGDTVFAIDEIARYIAVGREEKKVIRAEELLATLTGLPSIESPVDRPLPNNIVDEEIPEDGSRVYYIIGVLLFIIAALSLYVFKNRGDSIAFFENKNTPKNENKKSKSNSDIALKDYEAPVDREINNGGDRWLKTDKDTISEVDRLMDKFEELEEGGKKIDSKISNVMKNINKK